MDIAKPHRHDVGNNGADLTDRAVVSPGIGRGLTAVRGDQLRHHGQPRRSTASRNAVTRIVDEQRQRQEGRVLEDRTRVPAGGHAARWPTPTTAVLTARGWTCGIAADRRGDEPARDVARQDRHHRHLGGCLVQAGTPWSWLQQSGVGDFARRLRAPDGRTSRCNGNNTARSSDRAFGRSGSGVRPCHHALAGHPAVPF